jgi:hypothetical protein
VVVLVVATVVDVVVEVVVVVFADEPPPLEHAPISTSAASPTQCPLRIRGLVSPCWLTNPLAHFQ